MALTRITKGVIKPNENYDTHDINSTGIITATGLNVSGNASIGGVLTYEDVTNIDSIGIITARSDVKVGTAVTITSAGAGFYAGIVTASSFKLPDGTSVGGGAVGGASSITMNDNVPINFGTDALWRQYRQGDILYLQPVDGGGTAKLWISANNQVWLRSGSGGTFLDCNGTRNAELYSTTFNHKTDVKIPDKIIHTDDEDTMIRFPAADTFAVETNGAERFSIDSSGDFKFESCNDSYFSATGTLTLDYKSSNTLRIRNFTKTGGFYWYPMNDNYPVVIGSEFDTQRISFYKTGEINVGTGITLSGSTGNIIASGIITATNFAKADGSSLGGVASDSSMNTLGGTDAGAQLTGSASRMTFFGFDAGTAQQNGEKNTFVGAIAGKFQNNTDYNTAVGDSALCQNSGSYNTGVGYNAAAGESERLTMEHTVAVGYNALRKIDEADFNVAMGSRALENCVTGNSNIAIGYKSLFNANASSDNVAIGSSTGINLSSAANENTFIGYNAGQGVTTGDRNVAIGMNAMASTDYSSGGKTGSDNIAIGRNTMSRNTGSGSNNVFIGSGNNAYRCSNGSNNIGIGQYTFYYLTTGNSNIALGNQALDYCDTGHSNIALGQSALTELTGGSGTNNDNIAIGSGVATNLENGANNIIIGKNATTTAATVSNEITLGNNNNDHLRVPGIGVSFSTSGNHITGITTFSSHVQIPDAVASNEYASLYLGDGNDVRFFHNGQHTFWQHKLGTPNNGGSLHIDAYGSGGMYLRSGDGSTGVENAIRLNNNGSVDLYYSGSKKLETTSSGVTVTGSVTDSKGDLRDIPQNSQSSTYTLVASDAGKHIKALADITIPANVFSIGDAVTIINSQSNSLSIIQGSSTTVYNTADGSTGNRTLAGRGMATFICTDSNYFYISGSGMT